PSRARARMIAAGNGSLALGWRRLGPEGVGGILQLLRQPEQRLALDVRLADARQVLLAQLAQLAAVAMNQADAGGLLGGGGSDASGHVGAGADTVHHGLQGCVGAFRLGGTP